MPETLIERYRLYSCHICEEKSGYVLAKLTLSAVNESHGSVNKIFVFTDKKKYDSHGERIKDLKTANNHTFLNNGIRTTTNKKSN